MKTINFFKYSFCLLFSLAISAVAMAQPPDNGDPVNVPIDGGLSLLVAAGVAYGARKGYKEMQKRKAKEQEK